MSAPQNVSVDSSSSRHIGCVKWFDNRKGFGFINNLSNNAEVFVHHTGLSSKENCFRTLYPGEYVEYHLYHDDQSNRDYAVNVTGVQGGSLLCENTGTRISVRRQRDGSQSGQQASPAPTRKEGGDGFRKVERRGGNRTSRGGSTSRGRGGRVQRTQSEAASN